MWLSDSLQMIATQNKKMLAKIPLHIINYCAYQQFLVGLPCAVTLSFTEEVVKYFKSTLLMAVSDMEVILYFIFANLFS